MFRGSNLVVLETERLLLRRLSADDAEFIVELQMPQRDFVEYDFGGHDFRRGCRNDEHVGILLEQDALRGRIDQNRMGSAGLKRLGEGRGDAPGRSLEENREQECGDRIRMPGTKKARDRSNCLHCAPPQGRTSGAAREETHNQPD